MSRGPRPKASALSREYILEKALGLVDEVGPEGFTFRKLALKIGADPMAAFHYFPNKAALFDGIVETIYREVRLRPAGAGRSPRLRVLAAARDLRAAFLRHPRAIPLLGTRPAATRAMASLIDSFLALLISAGVPVRRALDTVSCLIVFIIGHTLAQVGEPVGGTDPAGGKEFLEEAKRYPHFSQAVMAAASLDPNRQFEYGLTALVNGLLNP